MEKDRKIVLEEKDILEFEQIINSLPMFAKNVSENMAVSHSITHLMSWLGSKIVIEDDKSQNIRS